VIWKSLPAMKFDVNREPTEMMAPFNTILMETLKHTSLRFWSDKGGSRVGTSDIPDFVIYSGDTWELDTRTRILVDLDLKLEFNPEVVTRSGGNANSKYPGDTKKAYIQLLNRANRAFAQAIVTDFASIIFYKFTYITGVEIFACGPLAFGGEWDGKSVTFKRTTKQPDGFNRFVSLICGRELNTTEVINEAKSVQYFVDKLIGRGKHSMVFMVHNTSGRFCLKIDPIDLSTQIFNEIQVLKELSGCIGVPQLIFHGKVTFCGNIWYGIVTNVIGTSILETVNQSGCFLSDSECSLLAQKAIPILHAIHERHLIHGDIKPEHLVLFNSDLYLIDYGASVPLYSFPTAYTHIYCPRSILMQMPATAQSDFENLWWTLLSLCQQLPWAHENELSLRSEVQMRLSYTPINLIQSYPKLASCFVDLF